VSGVSPQLGLYNTGAQNANSRADTDTEVRELSKTILESQKMLMVVQTQIQKLEF